MLAKVNPRTTVRVLAEELNVIPSTVAQHSEQVGESEKTRQLGTARIKQKSEELPFGAVVVSSSAQQDLFLVES